MAVVESEICKTIMLHDLISQAVIDKCNEIFNDPFPKWSAIAAIVLTDDSNDGWVKVVSITTGTKIIKGTNLKKGTVVVDCHAEVLARRAFIYYLYDQLDNVLSKGIGDKILCEDGKGKFALKSNIKVHLFLSKAPCGDAARFDDSSLEGKTRGQLCLKLASEQVGRAVVDDPEPLDWDSLQCDSQKIKLMSCSDKIFMWNVVGLQGALLSQFLCPIYLESVIIGSNFNKDHVKRALYGRLSIPNINKPRLIKANGSTSKVLNKSKRQPQYAINWMNIQEHYEIIAINTGMCHISSSNQSWPRLSKASMLKAYNKLKRDHGSSLNIDSQSEKSYKELKKLPIIYQKYKEEVKLRFSLNQLGDWIKMPQQVDEFQIG